MGALPSLSLVVAMLGMFAPPAVTANDDLSFDIEVHLEIDHTIGSKVYVDELQDEAESIWRPYGVHLVWSDAPARDAVFPVTAILGMHIDRFAALSGPLVLGRAFIDPRRPPLRPIRMSLRAAEQTLSLRRHAWTSFANHVHDHELARALGRVLAHEIGHVLLAVRYHEPTGLMREVFKPDELAGPDRAPFALTPNALGRLRSRIEHLRTPS